MIVFPNAKINLGLFITEKRTDGFHNLESLFLPIPLCDILEVTPSTEETSLICTGLSSDIPTEKNIVYKAWKLLQDAHGIGNVHIHLHKIIPSGAGMGGGSSDGSFMLKALNELFDLNMNSTQLENFAAQLGSDCPFFIKNTAALVTGRGERVEPIDFNIEGMYLMVVNPGIHVSTAEAFKGIQPRPSNFNWNEFTQNQDFQKGSLRNDFEESVFQIHPEIAEIKNRMIQEGAIFTSMSGTGSTVYALFEDEPLIKWSGNYYSGTFLL
ncbi:MAG: 4-diphosphocytidyl-2-C-methyl-D-erythritol kinase [Bacteroidota bacterium]|jgi:4-diphosphocytidyl-2-C-methyl-D-erythritol kinase